MPVTVVGPNSVLLAVVPEDVKVDIRRFTGFPSYGFGATGFYEMGLFEPVYEQLELRMISLTVSEYARITDLFLANLYQLETDIFNTRETVNIDTAAVYKRNLNESRERHNEFSFWRKQLCNFLGICPGPFLTSGGNNINLVV